MASFAALDEEEELEAPEPSGLRDNLVSSGELACDRSYSIGIIDLQPPAKSTAVIAVALVDQQ